tara:strand:- start:677 stop:823 length:147 start_codon:yes stop_codon:yes gene_type:complete
LQNLFVKLNNVWVLGRGQAVRHRFLVAAFGGSNPPAPAKEKKYEQLFK